MILPFAIKASSQHPRRGQTRESGWTLVEALVGLGVGMLALAAVASTTIFCLRSFAGIYNYSDLDSSSRQALDIMSREIREANFVNGYSPGSPASYIQLVNTNAASPITNTFTWDPSKQVLTWDKTGERTNFTLLAGCTNWSCTMLQGWPGQNYSFPVTALTPDKCKVVDLKWSCCRPIFRININSETEQGAQIALRNCQPP